MAIESHLVHTHLPYIHGIKKRLLNGYSIICTAWKGWIYTCTYTSFQKSMKLKFFSRFATIDMGRKLGAVPVIWTEAYLRTKWYLDPSSRLAKTRAENWGGGCTHLGLGRHLTMWQSRGLSPYQVPSWSIQPFGHNRHGPNIAAAVPLFRG